MQSAIFCTAGLSLRLHRLESLGHCSTATWHKTLNLIGPPLRHVCKIRKKLYISLGVLGITAKPLGMGQLLRKSNFVLKGLNSLPGTTDRLSDTHFGKGAINIGD